MAYKKNNIPWNKGKKCPQLSLPGKRNGMFGKHHSEGTKKKYSEVRKGHAPWNKGIPSSEATRKKISENVKGKLIGRKHPNWKGGKIKCHSRWHIWQFNHPFACSNYVLRSRLVAEKCLSRYLTRKEEIHHINEIIDDDRPENLYLFYSKSKHTSYENLKNKPKLKSNLL